MISYELKQRWVEALRTGKYPPHRGSFYGPGGSACAFWLWSQHRLAWWIDTYVPSEPEELTIPRE